MGFFCRLHEAGSFLVSMFVCMYGWLDATDDSAGERRKRVVPVTLWLERIAVVLYWKFTQLPYLGGVLLFLFSACRNVCAVKCIVVC